MVDIQIEISDGLQVLLEAVDLIDIGFLEITARVNDPTHTDTDEDGGQVQPTPPVDDELEEFPTQHSLSLSRKDDGTAFRVTIRTEIQPPDREVIVRCYAEYAVASLDVNELEEDVLLEFANHMATMTIVPYLRQGVADVTQRVFGAGLLMPIIRRGDFNFVAANRVPQ